ncbi:phosphoribosylglycinamide formyltransferase [Celerinatantimonas yamalensis]|uniref:Phosphoribosylglycinamide formyltransferase n=1 Tax=Celerinatantimonas yamalensis TaxID=559956 RepID=A0ABW9G9S3_9GAMM
MSLTNSQPKRIAVFISGFGSNLQALIDACQRQAIDGEIVLVASNQAKAFGLTRAAEAGIDTAVVDKSDYSDRDSYDVALAELIDDYTVDLIVLAGFMRILSPAFVARFSGKLLNIHPSLLPNYPGLHTHQRALENGDNEHGCSIHFVTSELDGGPVILQAKVPIFAEDTVQLVAQRVNQQELAIYPLVVKWFCQDRLLMKDGQVWLDDHLLGPAGYASDNS